MQDTLHPCTHIQSLDHSTDARVSNTHAEVPAQRVQCMVCHSTTSTRRARRLQVLPCTDFAPTCICSVRKVTYSVQVWRLWSEAEGRKQR